MRIVIVCNQETPHIIQFLETFLEAGHTVGLVFLTPDSGSLLPPGAKTLWRSTHPLTSPLDVADSATTIADHVQPFMPDVLFAAPLDTAAYAAALMRCGPVVAVCMAYDILLNAEQNIQHMDAVKQSLSNAQRVLVDNRFLVDKVIAHGVNSPAHIACMPYGINLSRFAKAPHVTDRAIKLRTELGLGAEEKQDVLVVANRRHDPLYYPQTTLKGFAAALKECPQLFLHMAGSGSMTEELKALAATLDITDRVHFAGWLEQEDLPVSLAAADIYVSSSSVDGSSISMLQAMASGLPIITTDIPGNQEWVARSHCGMLTPVGDDTALAHALCSLAAMDPKERGRLGKAGQSLAENEADWKTNSKKILQLVHEAATCHQGGM
nr:glycosyltransferase family 4 protein [uncultured Pseudodesulfovibrio sp.]